KHIRIHLLPGRALRRQPSDPPASGLQHHQNPPPARKGITTLLAPRALDAFLPDQNPPPARKGITTPLEPTTRLSSFSHQNPPPARKGITTKKLLSPSSFFTTSSESTSCPEGHYDLFISTGERS